MEEVSNPSTNSTDFPRRGHIYDVSFDPVVGSGISRRRPALIVSNDLNNEHSQTVAVVPLTGQPGRRTYPFEVLIPHSIAGLTSDSRAKCNQIRTVDQSRLVVYRGALTHQYMLEVEKALKIHLDIR